MISYLVSVELDQPPTADLAAAAARDLYGYQPEVRSGSHPDHAQIVVSIAAEGSQHASLIAVGLIEVHQLGQPLAVEVCARRTEPSGAIKP